MSALTVFLREFVACGAVAVAVVLAVWAVARAPGLVRW